MKKNTMMRLASFLLVAVLISTSAISGTYAKYVTSGSASDNARVAAWGFGDSTTITFDLFDPSYDGTVLSKDGVTNVIAPGSSKTDTVKLNYANTTGLGAPEVDYKVELNVTASSVDDDIESNQNITWSFNGTSYDTFAAMVAAIEGYEETVEANNLPTITTSGLTISWNWEFSTSDEDDAFDTAMGNKAELDEVSLTIEFVATQID